jgi:hypothetical protein
MDNNVKPQNVKSGSEIASAPGLGDAVDAMGYWFAAIVLCAVLAAGVIVYRSGNSGLKIASNDAPSPPTVLVH